TAAAPAFSLAAGAYSSAQSVTLSTTAGASIRYTTNGSTPTQTSGTLYTGAIAVNTTTTIKAIAYQSNWADSAVVSATYTITPLAVSSITPSSGSGFGQQFSIAAFDTS